MPSTVVPKPNLKKNYGFKGSTSLKVLKVVQVSINRNYNYIYLFI